ncbi:MAG: hypothetical protein HOY79_05965 [Streptomyces sp.]|nr:hypothetical protein [Streptomyces sp.]
MSTLTTTPAVGTFAESLAEMADGYPTDPEGTALVPVTVTDPSTGEQHQVPIEPVQLAWVTALVRGELDTFRAAHSGSTGYCGHSRGTGLAGGTGTPHCPPTTAAAREARTNWPLNTWSRSCTTAVNLSAA